MIPQPGADSKWKPYPGADSGRNSVIPHHILAPRRRLGQQLDQGQGAIGQADMASAVILLPAGWRGRVQGQGVTPGQMSARADLDVTVRDLIVPGMSGPAKVKFKAGAKLEKDSLTLTGLTLDGPGMTGAGAFRLNMPGFDSHKMTMTGNLDLDVADISVPLSLVGQKASG